MSLTDTDRVRALVEGRLPPDEAAAVRARLEADPDLRAFHEAWLVIHEMTAVAVGGGEAGERPPLAATRPAPRRWVRPLAAAAVMLLAIAIVLVVRRPLQAETLELSAVPLASEPAGADAPLVADAARALAAWPSEPGIHWLESFEEGRELSRLTGRPLLLFVYHPTCPLCVQLRKVTFTDGGVQGLVGEFIPVHVNVLEAPEDVQADMAGWPWLAAHGPDGRRIRAFPGFRAAPDMQGELVAALAETELALALPWDQARELARRYAAGLEATAAGRLGESWRAFEDVRRAGGSAELARSAEREQRRVGQEARVHLLRAELRAAEDAELAAQELAAAASRFEGSPLADDLRRVEGSLRRTGRFPHISSSKS